jgi:hypothetical protein
VDTEGLADILETAVWYVGALGLTEALENERKEAFVCVTRRVRV